MPTGMEIDNQMIMKSIATSLKTIAEQIIYLNRNLEQLKNTIEEANNKND